MHDKTDSLTPTINSDIIHNQNCHAFLQQIKPQLHADLLEHCPSFLKLSSLPENYDPKFPYGNLYSSLLRELEETIFAIKEKKIDTKIELFDNLINAIYCNNSEIMNKSSLFMQSISKHTTPFNNPKNTIKKHVKDKGQQVNTISPQYSDSMLNTLLSTYPNFNPQAQTNIPSIKQFDYKKKEENAPIELRLCTQAQRRNGTTTINPLFVRWLEIHAKLTKQNEIAYVYFNNLSLDSSSFGLARNLESHLATELHALEDKNPHLHLAVITLPSSGGIMDINAFTKTKSEFSYDEVRSTLLNAAQGKPSSCSINDFRISALVKKLLYANNEEEILSELLDASFQEMGVTKGQTLSCAQKQAVYLHFIKYKLTDFIITTLKPKAYNFTCKDGIDRGAVSSSYYNLFKSFSFGESLTREEFDRSLHTAALNARGRGMNHQREVIWNAIDIYVNANCPQLIKNPKQAWLIYWRDMNCPPERVKSLLQSRIQQCKDQLNDLPSDRSKLKKQGIDMMGLLEKENPSKLLFELVARTSELLLSPTAESVAIYQSKADEYIIKNPGLQFLASLFKALIATLLLLPTLGYSSRYINEGISTAKAAFFFADNKKLVKIMKDFPTKINAHEEINTMIAP